MNPSAIGAPVSMCDRVRGEVARHEGVDPERLDRQLSESVDPEELDELLTARSERMTFHYCGYDVRANSAGVVTVDPDGS
jgi:hypothetical protein